MEDCFDIFVLRFLNYWYVCQYAYDHEIISKFMDQWKRGIIKPNYCLRKQIVFRINFFSNKLYPQIIIWFVFYQG